MASMCFCGSNKKFDKCCGRYLVQGARAPTPEKLMRARFCAYYLGKHGQYLLSTWHDSTRPSLSAAQLCSTDVKWCKLEVLARSQVGDRGFVHFKAYYLKGVETFVLEEQARFLRERGCWYYIDGEVSEFAVSTDGK